MVWVWETIASFLGTERVRVGRDPVELPSRANWLKTSPVLAIAFVPLFLNWSAASRAGETDTRDLAHDLLNSVEPYGILVTAETGGARRRAGVPAAVGRA